MNWPTTFLILALISGIFGMNNLSGAAETVAEFLCVAFLVLFVVARYEGNLGSKNL